MKRLLPVLIAGVLAAGVAGPAVRATDSSTLLAGFGIKVVGVGLDVSYDSPSAPVPLSPSPTAELAFGYSLATLDAGPIGHALASVLWPGAFIANIAPLVSAQLPKYPVRAEAFSPQGPAKSTNTPFAGTDMQASAAGLLSEASSHAASAGAEALASAGSAASTARTAIENNQAVGRATATATAVKIGGGAVAVDAVVTTARVTSAGGKPKIEGKTTVTGLTIGGTPAVIDDDGVHAAAAALSALDASGISLRLANPVDVIKGTSGSRTTAGLLVTLTPSALRTAVAALPPDLAAQVQSTVVLDQTVTISVGGAAVAAASTASPLAALAGTTGAGRPELDSADRRTLPGSAELGGSAPESAVPGGTRETLGSVDSGLPALRNTQSRNGNTVLAARPASSRLTGGYGGNAPVWIGLAILGALFMGWRIRGLVDTLLFGAAEEEE